MIPGELLLAAGSITANVDLPTQTLTVSNTGDRPIQIGSHFHFFEVNRYLLFKRADAWGMRLNIPSGTAVRFEPGETRTVELVAFSGPGPLWGANNLTAGSGDKAACLERAAQQGFTRRDA